MKSTVNMKVRINDNLIQKWVDLSGKVFIQRKRLPNNTDEDIKMIQKIYFKNGGTALQPIIWIKDHYNWGLKQAHDYFNSLRGRNRSSMAYRIYGD